MIVLRFHYCIFFNMVDPKHEFNILQPIEFFKYRYILKNNIMWSNSRERWGEEGEWEGDSDISGEKRGRERKVGKEREGERGRNIERRGGKEVERERERDGVGGRKKEKRKNTCRYRVG